MCCLSLAWELVLSGDLKLRFGQCRRRARKDEIFGLIAEMAEVGMIRKFHERNPFHMPAVRVNRAKGNFANGNNSRLGFYPFCGPDASLTLLAV